ncbi:hypothetical protein [Streptomyces sp. NPDC002676]
MGERESGGRLSGLRRAHPRGAVSSPGPVDPGADVDALLGERLGATLRADGADPEGEQRAVAAFRAARDAGAHRARTRRRDDWRPREPHRLRLSLKGTLSVAVASLALGGVAVAAIGSGEFGGHGGDPARSADPSASAPERTGAGASGGSAGQGAGAAGSGSARPHHPETAKDALAHCRAYEQVGRRGSALDATAWRRLVTAAGGEEKVSAYCAGQAEELTREQERNPDKSRNAGNTSNAGNAGSASNGTNSSNSSSSSSSGDKGDSGKSGSSGSVTTGQGKGRD